ncbi:MAG: hypothetical protein OXI10_12645, partial [Gammaproteobacteria bacterium]|nr:hypothetical protein [Gammaproteobacteria bacterium]
MDQIVVITANRRNLSKPLSLPRVAPDEFRQTNRQACLPFPAGSLEHPDEGQFTERALVVVQ